MHLMTVFCCEYLMGANEDLHVLAPWVRIISLELTSGQMVMRHVDA
jgi:hypothetical protein